MNILGLFLKVTIVRKIAAGFVVLIAIQASGTIGYIAWQRNINAEAQLFAGAVRSSADLIDSIYRESALMSAHMRNATIIAGSLEKPTDGMVANFTEADIEKIVEEMKEISSRVAKLAASLKKSAADAASESETLSLAKELDAAWRAAFPEMQSAVTMALDGGRDVSTDHIVRVVAPLEADLVSVIKKLKEIQATRLKEANSHAADLRAMADATGYVTILVCAFIGGLVSLLIARVIRQRTESAIASAERIAGGDLDHHISTSGTDEIAKMCRAFAAMVRRVTDGAKIIKKKSNDMAAMLKTMPQGLLTIDENNVVQPEYSAHLAAILETDEIAGRSVMELVFAGTTLSSDALSQVEAIAGACVGEDAMNFTFNRHLLVPEIEKVMPDGRTKVLELTWSAIVNDADVTEQILLCIRDVTELRQLSQEAAAQKRELEIIGQVLAVPVEKFEAMMASAYEHLERTEEIVRVSAGGVEAVNDAFKHLHTIKGNARTYALKHLASVVHDAEQVYADLRSGQAQAQWDTRELLSGLDELRSEIAAHERISREKLSRKADGAPKTMCVSEEELRALLDKLHRASESQSIDVLRSVVHQAHRVLRRIKAQSFKSIADDIVAGLSDLARDLGKPAPQVHIEDDVVAIDTQASMALSDAFVHILRNALDHGIESPEERQAAGKPQAGRIEVTTRVDEDWVTVTVRDDGRGLALQRIRADAQAKGLVADAASLDDQAAANLIFVAGFSTAERVTMVSGRGVGMDAVQSAVRALGGDVSIRFEDDRTGADYRQFSMLVKVPASLAVNFNQ